MKHFFQATCVAAILTASIFSLSAFISKSEVKTSAVTEYQIGLVDIIPLDNGNEQWTWTVTNPNPGNGQDGTLQDVSHTDLVLTAEAEAALVAAYYSFDGVTWFSSAIVVERDPSIRTCTGTDVLKFDIGTDGTAPTYLRVELSDSFEPYPNCAAFIKTGGGQVKCNFCYYALPRG